MTNRRFRLGFCVPTAHFAHDSRRCRRCGRNDTPTAGSARVGGVSRCGCGRHNTEAGRTGCRGGGNNSVTNCGGVLGATTGARAPAPACHKVPRCSRLQTRTRRALPSLWAAARGGPEPSGRRATAVNVASAPTTLGSASLAPWVVHCRGSGRVELECHQVHGPGHISCGSQSYDWHAPNSRKTADRVTYPSWTSAQLQPKKRWYS